MRVVICGPEPARIACGFFGFAEPGLPGCSCSFGACGKKSQRHPGKPGFRMRTADHAVCRYVIASRPSTAMLLTSVPLTPKVRR